MNKDSNGYTFLFAIILVAVVGTSLASLSVGLKPRQAKNVEVKKKMDILGAIKIESTRKTATEVYSKYILSDECLIINDLGEVVDGDAFKVDIKKEYRDKKLPVTARNYPLYVANIDGSKKYIIPMVGSGLWGPIWGYIAVNEDKKSIFGAVFDHKTETPGLGAEIKTAAFQKQFVNELISDNGTYKKMRIVKDGSGSSKEFTVDGITGGTITSKGVEEMLDRTVQVYVNYFNK
ncbi:NADH:ubiquinone reductase (Na(+)-transporting) subunit C [Putridiphycobacter roseus]|uniref:Na(+)-translocating NADH-quinone reductase subunit C n=1 Tax=Putridiphycobacter roseus TaxID=2219161 RepID=A0A2W1NTH5_9FLAO|nr:NADH:ubiquinone reductase (Na(+)-transporting) subunit C [Putridiphycobacter roseus]